jgi:predicted nucleic acid-binding protein
MSSPKKKCLLDASSAILLYKGSLLKDLIQMYRVILTEAVFAELTIPGYSGAEDFIGLVENNRITLVNKCRRVDGESESLYLGDGERETIACFKDGAGDFVIVDDKKAARYCRDHSIPYINALLFARIQLHCNKVTHEQYLNHMERLINIGRYSAYLIEFAYNCEPADIEYFLPS